MSDNNNNNITDEAAAAVASSTARQGVTTSTSSATSTSLASSLNLAPFVASVLRDKVVADLQAENTRLNAENTRLQAENTRLNEQLASQTASIEGVRTLIDDAEEELRAHVPAGIIADLEDRDRLSAHDAAMLADRWIREAYDRRNPHDAGGIDDLLERDDDGTNNNHDNVMDGDDTLRDDDRANDDHDNTMDGDDTPTLNISVVCVVSIILYGIFLWIDRWEYRRLTTE